MTTSAPPSQFSPRAKGRVIGLLLLLPLLLHAALSQCYVKGAWSTSQGLFAVGFLGAAIALAWVLVKRPKTLSPVPAWKAALLLLSIPALVGALAVAYGLGFARAAVFFTAKEHVSTTMAVISNSRIRGCPSYIEYVEPIIYGVAGACASDFGLAPRKGDRIVVEMLVSSVGMRILRISPGEPSARPSDSEFAHRDGSLDQRN